MLQGLMRLLGSAAEASRAARAWATAAGIAPRSTGSPGTLAGTTRGRDGQMLATYGASRASAQAAAEVLGLTEGPAARQCHKSGGERA